MQNLLSSLALMVSVGTLAVLAQWSRKSRMAEVSLLFVLAILSLVLLRGGLLLGIMWTSGQMPSDVYSQKMLAITAIPVATAGLIRLALCLPTLVKIVGSRLPLVLVAVLGVGAGIRRNLRETFTRLGYGPISFTHLGIVTLFIVGAFALSVAADILFAQLQPDLYREVGELTQTLFNPKGLSPVSAVLFALLIGVGAGLGEETLFRGAVQPVLGILPTSILFASMHVQYGPSLLLGYIFVLSVGLGLLRRYFNTTTSFLAHAGYNTSGILAAYFFSL